jgi:hypothetical protein
VNLVNTQCRLATRPVGLPKPSDWQIVDEPARSPADGEFLVRVISSSAAKAVVLALRTSGSACGQVGGSCPSCCRTEYRFATPQWSVIFPSRTRMASTVSNWMVLPVAAMPRKSPRWVPW